MSVVAIIQARMGSTRLPGKVLRDLLGRPMLERMLERLGACETLDAVTVATSTDPKDDPLAQWCEEQSARCFRGSEDDVLERFALAARHWNGTTLVRLTGDCPLIDPRVVDKTVQAHLDSDADYTSNVVKRTYPRGLDTEVMTREALERAHREATKSHQREHVTPYLVYQPELFRIGSVVREDGPDASGYRLTVDTPEDFQLIERIFESFAPRVSFSLAEIISLLESNPELLQINQHIEQKKLTDS